MAPTDHGSRMDRRRSFPYRDSSRRMIIPFFLTIELSSPSLSSSLTQIAYLYCIIVEGDEDEVMTKRYLLKI